MPRVSDGLLDVPLLGKALHRIFEKRSFDQEVGRFLLRVLLIALRVVLVVMVAGMLGFETTSLVALIGALGLAVGMAMSGALQNFAGGVIILVQRPFRVGNWVQIGDESGSVMDIGIFHTELKTIDTKKVLIPNGEIISSNLTNYHGHPLRRLDLTFRAGFDADLDLVKEALTKVINAETRILRDSEDQEPMIAVRDFGESSVNYLLRAWVHAAEFTPATWAINEAVKREFDARGISMPYPHRVVVQAH